MIKRLSWRVNAAINIGMVQLMWVLFLLYHYTQMKVFMLLLYADFGVWLVFISIPIIRDIGGFDD